VSYRDDVAAANARAEALQKELDDARAEIATLQGRDEALARLAQSGIQLSQRQAVAARWLGAPTRLSLTREIDHEISEDLYPELVDCIRRRLGNAGTVSTLKGSLTWTMMSQQRPISVYVSSRHGKTTITIDQSLGTLAGGIFGGIGGGVGGGMVGLTVAAAAAATPLLIPVAILGWLGTVYGVCRRIYRNRVHANARTLQALLDELCALAGA